jgi:hypothetical protein
MGVPGDVEQETIPRAADVAAGQLGDPAQPVALGGHPLRDPIGHVHPPVSRHPRT